MKAPNPILVIPAGLLGTVAIPWLLYSLASLTGPMLLLGGVLVLWWRNRRQEKPRLNIPKRSLKNKALHFAWCSLYFLLFGLLLNVFFTHHLTFPVVVWVGAAWIAAANIYMAVSAIRARRRFIERQKAQGRIALALANRDAEAGQ